MRNFILSSVYIDICIIILLLRWWFDSLELVTRVKLNMYNISLIYATDLIDKLHRLHAADAILCAELNFVNPEIPQSTK